nr:type IV inositol polyphosphate 5-phosphatase 9 [Ipomoea batatas]
MWPRLVASKILKKRLGSNNFVADIPSISDDSEEFLVEAIPPRFDDDHQKSLSSNHILAHHQETQSYKCIISKQMVGILISVWIRNEHRLFVRNPSVSCVGCGIMGCLGNKGAVSVRFRLHETSFCFVCSHLASGGREGDEKFRNSNAAEILSRTTFPKGPSHELPRKIQDHESEMLDGQVFKGWHEGIIKFAPTYKYYPNSDGYYGGVNGKKGEKKRAPAWCDRIIWFGEGLKQHKYGRGESKLSDHRPVRAIFSAEVKVSKIKKLRNFFLSERFEHITHRLEVHPSEPDDYHHHFQYSNARLSLHIS